MVYSGRLTSLKFLAEMSNVGVGGGIIFCRHDGLKRGSFCDIDAILPSFSLCGEVQGITRNRSRGTCVVPISLGERGRKKSTTIEIPYTRIQRNH